MIGSCMNNSLAIATAEKTSNYCLSLVPRQKSLPVQKYSKNSKTAWLDFKEVCIFSSEFRAKTTNNQSEKQRQGSLLTVGDMLVPKQYNISANCLNNLERPVVADYQS